MTLRQRIGGRWAALSVQGVPTETIAASAAVGLIAGVCPVYGCPTLLCLAAAVWLRLNLPVLQAVNFLTSPLQWALLVPFHRLGHWLIPQPAAAAHAGWMHVAAGIAMLAARAVAGWVCTAVPLGILVYLALGCVATERIETRAA